MALRMGFACEWPQREKVACSLAFANLVIGRLAAAAADSDAVNAEGMLKGCFT